MSVWQCYECGKAALHFVGEDLPKGGDVVRQKDWIRADNGETPVNAECPFCKQNLRATLLDIKDENDLQAE